METSLTIANRSFIFDHPAEYRFPKAYDAFLEQDSAQNNPSSAYQVSNELEIESSIGSVIWEGPTWRMRQHGETYFVDLQNIETEHWVPSSMFSKDFSGGIIRPVVGRVPAPSPWVLNYPLDQILFINRLPRLGAVLLHASGVFWKGEILLFCGRSDIGKTTLARLFRDQGATLLNDDRMLIWNDPNGISASPSPWHGEDPEINHVTAPVRAIFHLGQANDFTLSELSGAEAVSALTATAVLPFYLQESLTPALEIIDSSLRQTRSFRFNFKPDAGAVDFLKTHVIESKITI